MSRLSSCCTAVVLALLVRVPLAHAQQPALERLPPPPVVPLPPPEAVSSDPPGSEPPSDGPPSESGSASDAAGGPTPPPSSEPPRPVPGKAPSGRDFRPILKAAAGFQYAEAHAVPITGGRLRLGAGAHNDSSAFYAGVSMLYGSTSEGLRAWDLRGTLGGDVLRTGIFRLGLDLEMGYLVVRRATVDSRMWALGFGGGVHASVDAYQFGPRDDHAIFIEGKLDAHLHFGGAFMWGPSIFAGVRY